MEYLDPKKRRAHLIRLFIGYALVATALILTTTILLYQAYGFGLKNGQVIQKGLVFISSLPNAADIYINGSKKSEVTNTRLLMQAGQYSIELKREGYRSWKRAVSLEGGAVQRLDYPMLFPAKLDTEAIKTYSLKPSMLTQSPDRRWLVVQAHADYKVFEVIDTSKTAMAAMTITLPENISSLTGSHQWIVQEWASDNSHLLLKHVTNNNGQQASEYILLNRDKPIESINLTNTLGVNSTTLELLDRKYDKYIAYNATERTLQMISLGQPMPQTVAEQVLAYKTYGQKMILYASSQNAPDGKSIIKLHDGDKTYDLRTVAAGSPYMLELAKYDDRWLVVLGAASENRTYIYEDPIGELRAKPEAPLVPLQVLKTENPNYVSFSKNTRFIITQNGQQFSVYDAEYDKRYVYTVKNPLDAPQTHVEWMDGHHLTYTSGGKIVVLDYDNTNVELLSANDPAYAAHLNEDYDQLISLFPQMVKNESGQDVTSYVLAASQLRTARDR